MGDGGAGRTGAASGTNSIWLVPGWNYSIAASRSSRGTVAKLVAESLIA